MSRPDKTVTQTVTIAAGASLSGASAKYSGYRLLAAVTASTWDAAKLTFMVSNDGTNFFDLTSEGTEYEVASVTAAKAISLDLSVFAPWDYVKVRSGTSAAAVNQADATIVTLVFMPI
jgi:hypothetical protein